jgi:hypothetical protein
MLNSPQFKRGKDVEAFLDDFFRFRGWYIEQTTAHEERALCLGDRHFSKGDQKLTIEYKSGIQTFYSGNVFLETISVDTQGKPGWVYTCKADYIFYAALLNGKILVFKPDYLRSVIDDLKTRFREVPTSNNQNKGYNTHGVIVPLDYAMRYLATKIIEV